MSHSWSLLASIPEVLTVNCNHCNTSKATDVLIFAQFHNTVVSVTVLILTILDSEHYARDWRSEIAELGTVISKYGCKTLRKPQLTVGEMTSYKQGGSLGFWLALPSQPGRGF